MRVFVYEYTCATDTATDPLAASLRAEGSAMLSALMGDFGRIPEVETFTQQSTAAPDHEEVFRNLAAAADWTLVIAPECNGILRTRCRWVLESGGRLLGPSPAAVALTSDKLALCQHLRKLGVPTPQSLLFVPGHEWPNLSFPMVWKPREGAGSQATFLVRDEDELRACTIQARAEGWQGESLIQPFIPGLSASVAFLTGRRSCVALLPAEQCLSADGRFHYLGGKLPLATELARRAVQLAKQAVQTVPKPRGYLGVDVVLGADSDGGSDCVIEINPRPTTSYIGLRALAQTNLAEVLLHAAVGDEIPQIQWQAGAVQFGAAGTVQWNR